MRRGWGGEGMGRGWGGDGEGMGRGWGGVREEKMNKREEEREKQ